MTAAVDATVSHNYTNQQPINILLVIFSFIALKTWSPFSSRGDSCTVRWLYLSCRTLNNRPSLFCLSRLYITHTPGSCPGMRSAHDIVSGNNLFRIAAMCPKLELQVVCAPHHWYVSNRPWTAFWILLETPAWRLIFGGLAYSDSGFLIHNYVYRISTILLSSMT